ncbi:MAG: glycosyltransferase family 39 protein [Deltaproteobacteria bacterium]|nr:glycosyltransferase family 39 protein [Deltaproteobacteria bacterium]
MAAWIRKLSNNRDLLACLFLGLFVCAIYLPNLGSYAFWDPWEPHYAQVAIEMGDHGSWMDTWYRGQNRWWSKPILPLWLLRASFTAFGVEDASSPWLHFAGRFPIFLLSLMGILLTYGWVSRLYDRRTGIYSALVLATCPMYALLSHQIMFDLPFMAFCAPAIGYYFLARSPQGKPAHLYFFYILVAFAFLSKWLLAFFIPAGILFAFYVIRWDVGFFRRVGGYYWLGSGLFMAACATTFFLVVKDPAFAAMLCVVALGLLLIFILGRDAAVVMGANPRAHWLAFGCMLLIILPWHLFMIFKHGWPFVREAVIYHHFDRAAGTIGKPEGTFDVFFKQIAFATFPWVSFLPIAVVRLLRWGPKDLEGTGQRNLLVLLAAIVPWAAFSLFQTKFHHYIFPVIPFLAVIIGIFLARAASEIDRAKIRMAILLSVPVAAVLLLDILHNYKWFIHMFDYYYGWPLPQRLNPYPFFGVIGGAWLLILAWLFFRRKIGTGSFAAMAVVAATLSVFLTAWIMPRVTRTFTQESIYRAFIEETGGKAPIAQYNGWLSRSASFYFDNKVVDLSQADQPNLDKAIQFLKRPGRSFLILGAGHGRDCKSLLASLRPEVRKKLGKSLYVVFDGHPFSCLVSTERDPEGVKRVRESVLSELPADAHRQKVGFGGKIQLLGWRLNPPEVSPGESFTISYFFKCLEPVGDDWLVFIHGDGPQGGSHRVFGDHPPMGGLYPTSEWKVGDIVQDDYEMVVPSNYPYKNFTLWMGLWKGPKRLPVDQKHQHDGNDRVRTAFIRIR